MSTKEHRCYFCAEVGKLRARREETPWTYRTSR